MFLLTWTTYSWRHQHLHITASPIFTFFHCLLFNSTSSSLLLGLLSSLDLGKSPDSLPDALDEQRHGDHDPDKVAEEVVPPEVEALGTAVDDLEDALAEEAGTIVEEVAVDLAQADDELQRESDRVVLDGGPGQEKREGTPDERSDALHTHEERVLGEITRVGEGVFLPELGEEMVLSGELGKVDGKVACKGKYSIS